MVVEEEMAFSFLFFFFQGVPCFLSLHHCLSWGLKVQSQSYLSHMDQGGGILKEKGVILAIVCLSGKVFHT